jgi:hypothetical protein
MTFSAISNFSYGLRYLETQSYSVDFNFGTRRWSLAVTLSEQGDVFAISPLTVKTQSLTWKVTMMKEENVGPDFKPTLRAASSNLVEISP